MSATAHQAPPPPAAAAAHAVAPRRPPSPWHSVRAVVRQGLGDLRRAPLTWGGSLGLMGALMTAIWPSIEGSTAELMKSYPESLKNAFGIEQLNTVEQYVDAEMLSLIVPLTVAFFAVLTISRATVGAEERGWLDTMLSLPLSRRVLVAGTFIVTAVTTAAVLLVAAAVTWIGGTLFGTGISAPAMLRGYGNVWPLAMGFAGLAMLAAGVLRRPPAVTAVATGTLFLMYVMDLVGKLSPSADELRVPSAFRYYGSAVQHGIDVSHFVGLTLVAVLLCAAGALLFERRDVR